MRLRLRHPRVGIELAWIADRRAGGGGAGPVGIAKFLAIGEAVAVGVQAGQRGVQTRSLALKSWPKGFHAELLMWQVPQL